MYNWTGAYDYGSIGSLLGDEEKRRQAAAAYNGIGDSGAGVDPALSDSFYSALQQFKDTGATAGVQEDGRWQRDAIFGPDGSVMWGGEPVYHKPDNPWKDAILPMAAMWFGAPMLGEAIGATGAATSAGSAAGSGAWLGEGIASGIPAWDAAATGIGGATAGGTAVGGALADGSGAWLGEGMASGVPAWDAAATKAGLGLTGAGFAQNAAAAANKLLGNPSTLLKGAGLLSAAGGAKQPEYNGPMPTITRGNWKPQVQAQTLDPQQETGLLNATGYANSGLWRFLNGAA